MNENWLLFIYKVPSEPSRNRAYVWRQLKQLGAVYLQQAVCVLPRRPELAAALNKLSEKILEMAGEATLLNTAAGSQEWEDRIVAESRAARDAEMAEVIENLERFEAEVARETAAQKFTFAELEDVESDLDKIARWLERIEGRDYFGAPLKAQAKARIQRAQALLDTFIEAVYRHEGVQTRGEAP